MGITADRAKGSATADPAAVSPRQTGSAIDNSPRMLAQRQLMSRLLGTGQSQVPSRPVVQGYFRVDHANQAAANIAINSTLPAMAHHLGSTSHRNAAGALNVVDDNPPLGAGPTATLRIADDGRLAIEDVDLTGRQPRVFFAEPNLVITANEQLRARTGANMLATNAGNTVQVPEAGNLGALHVLVEVTPAAAFSTSMNCDAVASRLTGANDSTTPVKLNPGAPDTVQGARTDDVYERLAHQVARGDTPAPGVLGGQLMDTANHMGPPPGGPMGAPHVPLPDPANVNNQVAHERAHAGPVAAAAMEAQELALGINAFADPDIGDMYGSMSLGAFRDLGGGDIRQFNEQNNQYMNPGQQSWGTHFGGVVMKSGGDHVTLENYNRNVEDVGVGGAADVHNRWYFQMYGTKRLAALPVDPALAGHIQAGDDVVGADQSWHHAWSTAGRPIINGVTAVIGKREQPQSADVLAALAHAGTAGSGEITRAHEVDLRINCTPTMQQQLMAPFSVSLSDKFNAMLGRFGGNVPAAATARGLAARAAILRVFATTNGDGGAKLAAALVARNQLDTGGAGSASPNTPPLLVGRLAGYGITVLPPGV
ncbi:hypothetical protein CDN98_18380 [Roseateles terrae]|nr:hypothetical protein CDN98_18380 [Roseateles terrae]